MEEQPGTLQPDVQMILLQELKKMNSSPKPSEESRLSPHCEFWTVKLALDF